MADPLTFIGSTLFHLGRLYGSDAACLYISALPASPISCDDIMALAGRDEGGFDLLKFIYENHGPLVGDDPLAKGEAVADVIYVSSLVGGGASAVRAGVRSLAGFVRGPGWGPPKPIAQDPDLQTIVEQLYRPPATVGHGGTGDIIRAGVGHEQKGLERITNLMRWLESHPGASLEDQHAAQTMIQDLISALLGLPYPGAGR